MDKSYKDFLDNYKEILKINDEWRYFTIDKLKEIKLYIEAGIEPDIDPLRQRSFDNLMDIFYDSKKNKSKTIAKAKSTSKGETVETDMYIKKGITPKMKRALKKSIMESIDNALKGSGLFNDDDSSSSDEEIITIKRRGRPKKKTI